MEASLKINCTKSQHVACTKYAQNLHRLLKSARPAVTPATPLPIRCLVNRGTMGANSLPKTVTRQRRDCDSNPGPSAPKSSTLTTRLPSHRVTLSTVTSRRKRRYQLTTNPVDCNHLRWQSDDKRRRLMFIDPTPSSRAKYCDERVCLSVCLSVRIRCAPAVT